MSKTADDTSTFFSPAWKPPASSYAVRRSALEGSTQWEDLNLIKALSTSYLLELVGEDK
jgi:hypothetical protein